MAPAAVNVAVRTAFMSIASRVVGATFRIGESYQPSVQAKGVTMDPDIIIKREVVGLVSSWILTFFASLGATPLLKRFKISQDITMFGIAVCGAAAAEAISRWVAYRETASRDDDEDDHPVPLKPTIPTQTIQPQPPLHRIYPQVPVLAQPLRPSYPQPAPALNLRA